LIWSDVQARFLEEEKSVEIALQFFLKVEDAGTVSGVSKSVDPTTQKLGQDGEAFPDWTSPEFRTCGVYPMQWAIRGFAAAAVALRALDATKT
jgi:hypothetical protein